MWREDVTVPACIDIRPCQGKMILCQFHPLTLESLWIQTSVITGFEVKFWNQFIVLLLYYSLNFSLVPVLHDPLHGKNGTHFDKWHRNWFSAQTNIQGTFCFISREYKVNVRWKMPCDTFLLLQCYHIWDLDVRGFHKVSVCVCVCVCVVCLKCCVDFFISSKKIFKKWEGW